MFSGVSTGCDLTKFRKLRERLLNDIDTFFVHRFRGRNISRAVDTLTVFDTMSSLIVNTAINNHNLQEGGRLHVVRKHIIRNLVLNRSEKV